MLGFNYTKSNGTLAKKEERLAWVLLFPTVLIIFSIVILPLISIFWISFKPISLSDLRPPKPIVKERLKGKLEIGGDKGEIHYSCLIYTSPSPRDATLSRMPSSA